MTDSKHIDVVVAGHLCLDLSPGFADHGSQTLKDILVPGRLVNVGPAALSTGGAVSNTGLTLRMLGLNTCLMGKVGTDVLGRSVRHILDTYGAADSLIEDAQAATAYSVVIAPPGIDRIFLHHPGANDTFCSADLDPVKLSDCRLFHFGYPPLMRRMYSDGGRELAAMFQLARRSGAATSLDLALPDPASPAGQAKWLSILARVLPDVDIFLPSLEELLFMLDRPLYERLKASAGEADICTVCPEQLLTDLGTQILAYGVKILAIKLGKRGYYVRTCGYDDLKSLGAAAPANARNWASRELWSEPFHVAQVASTSGAGDASIAGFLAGLLTGSSIETAAELACAVAGLKIQYNTSVGGIRPLAEVLASLPTWPKERMILGHDWRYNSAARLWFGKKDHASKPK
ncbi:MAG: carbohydrate kinase family protein [Clostridiaceae bacterium]|jgi:sugar/nucleoside kinase (ribokinase family)|nr:carbohydrate kinase family protein [Clostridiaceae bacterium]